MAKSMNLALAQYNEAMARLKNARVDLECAEAGVRKALAELAKYGIVSEREAAHDPKTCRVYRCWVCIGLGKKF